MEKIKVFEKYFASKIQLYDKVCLYEYVLYLSVRLIRLSGKGNVRLSFT